MEKFTPPDEGALLRLVGLDDVGALVVCLLWRAGLRREEVRTLAWAQVDFDARVLRLPGRSVPLDDELAEMLSHRADTAGAEEYVITSKRRGEPVSSQWISWQMRCALDGVGLTGVVASDLRLDYIRRALEKHDWPYVLRITGQTVENFRAAIAPRLGIRASARELPSGPPDGLSPEYSLWRLMQNEKDTPAGIALWLLRQMSLTEGEIVGLTWDDVDLDAGELRVSGRAQTMPRGVRRVLAEELARRAPGDDRHVILSPVTRRPLTAGRLSVMLRTALIRGGVDALAPVDVRRGLAGEVENTLILDHVARFGGISSREASKLLRTYPRKALTYLKALVDDGKLVRIGNRYYDAAETVAGDRHGELLLRHLAEHGSIACQDAAELFGVSARQAGRILARFVSDGKIILAPGTHRYVLPRREQ